MIATSLRRAALAAALLTVSPVAIAAAPASAPAIQSQALTAAATVATFYEARQNRPVWLRSGASTAAARQLISILRRSQVEGLASGPLLAASAEAAMARAQSGDPAAVAEAERILSGAWVQYVQTIRTPSPMMQYGDQWLRPKAPRPDLVLAEAASAPSLAAHMEAVSRINPLYAQLRDAAWNDVQQTGTLDGRIVANLERARFLPPTGRYVLVDAGTARLYMVENGQISDSMKVVVGTAETRTPMVASTIYYATLNPYWHVPDSLAKKLIAPGVLKGGIGYLKTRGYEVVTAFDNGEVLDPKTVDWKAVAAGTATVKVRQKPGAGNSMGDMKFHFANKEDVYLHDTPQKELFAKAQRSLSNGCIRLEDAPKLARWLMGSNPRLSRDAPEQHVQLAQGVPIFVTYLTAQPENGALTFRKDVYGYDALGGPTRVAAR